MNASRYLSLAALALLALGALVFQRRTAPAELSPASPMTATAPETPDDAVARVLALPADQRLKAAAAVLVDAAGQPDLAVRLARRFCDEDPAHIREHGDVLIHVLAEQGQFAAAFRFAELGGPERSEWLARALQLWTGKDPARAAEATLTLAEGDGFTLVATAWAERDPAGLADFVLRPRAGAAGSLPPETILTAWLEQNPGTVNSWLDRLE